MVAFQRGRLPVDERPLIAMKYRAPHGAATRRELRHAWVLPYRVDSSRAILDALLPCNRPRQPHQRLVAGLDAVQAELLGSEGSHGFRMTGSS